MPQDPLTKTQFLFFLKLFFFFFGCCKLSVHCQISHKVDSDSFYHLVTFLEEQAFKFPTLPFLLTTMKFKKL